MSTSAAPSEPRRRALDSPRVLTVAVVALVGVLFGLVRVANRTTEVSPLLSDVVLYTLYAVDLAILAALLFVLARNLLKLWLDGRRAVPFARFRAKLVAASSEARSGARTRSTSDAISVVTSASIDTSGSDSRVRIRR